MLNVRNLRQGIDSAVAFQPCGTICSMVAITPMFASHMQNATVHRAENRPNQPVDIRRPIAETARRPITPGHGYTPKPESRPNSTPRPLEYRCHTSDKTATKNMIGIAHNATSVLVNAVCQRASNLRE